jgi:hypothetical protein
MTIALRINERSQPHARRRHQHRGQLEGAVGGDELVETIGLGDRSHVPESRPKMHRVERRDIQSRDAEQQSKAKHCSPIRGLLNVQSLLRLPGRVAKRDGIRTVFRAITCSLPITFSASPGSE